MKRIKKILASLMVAVMVLTAAPLSGFVGIDLPNLFDIFASAESYSGTCGDNLTWSLDTSTGELVISGTGEMEDYSYKLSPWYNYRSSIKKITIKYGVKNISSFAFEKCTSLTSVTIPDSITSIGFYVFDECTSLTNITIPNSVTSIESHAFYGCNSLTSITIPGSVTSIGYYVFDECTSLTSITVDEDNNTYSSDEYGVLFNKDKTELIKYPIGNELTGYTIPDSVTSIGDSAFDDCDSLTIITIPDSVTSIGRNAFYGCNSLTSITIGNGVTSISSKAFYNTGYYNDSSNWEDDVLYIGNHLIEANTSISGAYTIKEGTKCIAECAFLGCTSLKSITIPDSVTSIGYSAFRDCTSLIDVYYTGTQEQWNSIAIGSSNDPLTSATIHFIQTGKCGDNLTWSLDTTTGELVISGEGEMKDYPTKYSNGSYITDAPWSSYVSSIRSVTIQNGATSIGSNAFYNCTSLTSITIPDSVTSIGDSAFLGCSSLTSITIPDSVTSIGYNAFYNCTSLTTVYYNGTQDQWDRITIDESNESILNAEIIFLVEDNGIIASGTCGDNLTWTLYDDGELVISGTGEMYSYGDVSEVQWNKYESLIKTVSINNGVTAIGNIVFAVSSCLTSITIPESVTIIGLGAFAYCPSLETVIFRGSEYIELGDLLFEESPKAMICCEENSYLHTYAGANNLKYCLMDENGVPSYEIKNDILLSYRGESTDVYLSTVTKIGYGAFENNSVVETVALSSSVYLISTNAFRNCSSLETVIIPESVTSIASGAFDGCDNLTIWCYAGSYADSYATANGINVEYIALDIEKDILILNLKGTSSLTASLNTPYAENSGVVWSSTNTSIATVDGNGNVKGIKAGTAVIVATSKEGGLRDYCVVKVVGIEALSTATIDHENGMISGITANADSLDEFITLSDPSCNLSYSTLGTDSTVYVKRGTEIVDAYTIVIFGDVNGDSWYDGQDAIIVDCLANGMLTKEDVGEAVYTAADCNHDGVIDQLDVALLNQAGTLLANVDQSKPTEVLLETSSEYVEYISLIDQSFEIDDETEDIPEVDAEETPETDVESENTTPEQDANKETNFFGMILNFIRAIIEMILSYIPVPYK